MKNIINKDVVTFKALKPLIKKSNMVISMFFATLMASLHDKKPPYNYLMSKDFKHIIDSFYSEYNEKYKEFNAKEEE